MLDLGSGQAADLAVPLDRGELIAYGPRLSDNGATRLGTAALVRRPDPDTTRAITLARYAAMRPPGETHEREEPRPTLDRGSSRW